jgi:RNA polymerase sigma-70 factor (ECF subfamily)
VRKDHDVTQPLTTTARAASDDAVAAQLEPHRRALTAHCYRMLGSAFEADDAVQETIVRAWRGIDRYEGRGPFEAWLFRIATNVCLNLLRGRGRRALPMDLGPAARPHEAVLATRPGSTWVGPVPNAWVLEPTDAGDPLDAAVRREALRLAFVTALQRLPARQRAVLILRDVLRWSTEEVAALLATSDVAVKSSLQRARTTMGRAGVLEAPAAELDDTATGLLEQYVDAFERYDVGALVGLLHDDATMSMPPYDLWLDGAADIATWWRRERDVCRESRLVPIAANAGPAVAHYRRAPAGGHEAFAIVVLAVADGAIASLHAFIEPALFAAFGMPPTI